MTSVNYYSQWSWNGFQCHHDLSCFWPPTVTCYLYGLSIVLSPVSYWIILIHNTSSLFQQLAQRTLLKVDEVKIWFEHLNTIRNNRKKKRAAKAAKMRRKKAQEKQKAAMQGNDLLWGLPWVHWDWGAMDWLWIVWHVRLFAMAMNVCGVRGSEHAYTATKWRSVMTPATKCAENDSLQ